MYNLYVSYFHCEPLGLVLATERIRVVNKNFAGLQQGAAQPGNHVAGGGESQSGDGTVHGKYGRRADVNAL